MNKEFHLPHGFIKDIIKKVKYWTRRSYEEYSNVFLTLSEFREEDLLLLEHWLETEYTWAFEIKNTIRDWMREQLTNENGHPFYLSDFIVDYITDNCFREIEGILKEDQLKWISK